MSGLFRRSLPKPDTFSIINSVRSLSYPSSHSTTQRFFIDTTSKRWNNVFAFRIRSLFYFGSTIIIKKIFFSSVGFTIYTAEADDRDDGVNGQVTYSIVQAITPGKQSNPFKMDAATGKLSLKEKLNFEAADEYFVTIKAEDGGTPKRYGKQFTNL